MAAFNSQLEVAMTLRGLSTIVVENQLEAVAASFETKHGDL